jgi:hypothetical protein
VVLVLRTMAAFLFYLFSFYSEKKHAKALGRAQTSVTNASIPTFTMMRSPRITWDHAELFSAYPPTRTAYHNLELMRMQRPNQNMQILPIYAQGLTN